MALSSGSLPLSSATLYFEGAFFKMAHLALEETLKPGLERFKRLMNG